jgi:AdoMet-dependent rRNA methyltransferase SPB1
MEFISGGDYVNILARSNTITFDGSEGKSIYSNPLTTDEIKANLEDLRVLGKKEFKVLIKWREDIRISLGLEKSRQEKRKLLLEQEEMKKKEEEAQSALPLTPEAIAEEVRTRFVFGWKFRALNFIH